MDPGKESGQDSWTRTGPGRALTLAAARIARSTSTAAQTSANCGGFVRERNAFILDRSAGALGSAAAGACDSSVFPTRAMPHCPEVLHGRMRFLAVLMGVDGPWCRAA
eukprot:SAG11_NODE_2905_length_2847_cov_2.094250_3_plen_108_part_00